MQAALKISTELLNNRRVFRLVLFPGQDAQDGFGQIRNHRMVIAGIRDKRRQYKDYFVFGQADRFGLVRRFKVLNLDIETALRNVFLNLPDIFGLNPRQKNGLMVEIG